MSIWDTLSDWASHACDFGRADDTFGSTTSIVNTATGLMCEGSSGIDALGSPLGTDLHDSFSSASSCDSWGGFGD